MEVKEHSAHFASALIEGGVPMSTIMSALEKTDYSHSERTLYRHIQVLNKGQAPLSHEKKTGAKQLLTDEEWWVVAGWILVQEKKVDLWMVQQWILANFKINVSVSTVSRWKDTLGLSFQLTSKRPMGSEMTHDDYVIGYCKFIQELRASGFWDFDRSKILCFDSVTNSMRSDRETTISLKGGLQKKLARNTPTQTNNYLVCVGLEGGLEFDVLMFTHDKTFDPNGVSWPDVLRWCKKLGLRSDQIFYSKSTKKYCAEQAAHISAFKDCYRKELKGT